MSPTPAASASADVASNLARLESLAALDHHLAVSVTSDPDGMPQVAVVNIGVVPDPITREPRVAFVARRGAKLTNLRRNPRATLVVRAGWEWIAVSGPVTLAGPDDPRSDMGAEQLRALQRHIFEAAGGKHPDLARYDEVMAAERRCAVLVRPDRFVTNPPASAHQEPA